MPAEADAIAGAIEVLRESSLLTYENRRISTGVLLMGPETDPYHPRPDAPPKRCRTAATIIGVKSFHRLCDGIKTLFLVSRRRTAAGPDRHSRLEPWFGALCLAAPTAALYHCHSVATFEVGHLCLVLTPNGEIKIFAAGVQVFSFLGGRWRLTDMAEKYHRWDRAVGDGPLAERIFRTALNMAENGAAGCS